VAEPRWLTVREVADRLSVVPETVRRMLRRSQLKGSNLGRRLGWRVRETDLEAFLGGQSRGLTDEGSGRGSP